MRVSERLGPNLRPLLWPRLWPRLRAVCWGTALLLAASAGVRTGVVHGQLSGQTGTSAASPASHLPGSGGNPMGPGLDVGDSPFADTTRQRRNDDRQRRIVSDTQRLVALANQLKTEIALSGAESMTPEMLHQMDEIEKLAKSVKDKMRD